MPRNRLIYKVAAIEDIGDIVRLTKKARQILNEHRRATGLPATKIIEQWAEFANDNFEIEER